MRIVIALFISLFQVALGIYIYRIDYNLHHYGSRSVNIALEVRDYMPLIAAFYLGTLLLAIFLKKGKLVLRIILVIFSIVGLYICISTNLNPF